MLVMTQIPATNGFDAWFARSRNKHDVLRSAELLRCPRTFRGGRRAVLPKELSITVASHRGGEDRNKRENADLRQNIAAHLGNVLG